MKIKSIIFITILFLSSIHLFSQEFDGGISLGIAGTQVQGDGISGFHKAGIFVGPFVNFRFSYRSSLQMQLEFAQKGSRKYPDSLNNFESYLLRLNYLQIPVKYQFRYNERFGFVAGLSYSVLIYHQEMENGYESNSGGYPYKKSDFDIHLGIDWFLTPVLTARIEFSHSLVPIRKISEVGNLNNIFQNGQYNNIILIALQYNISSFRRLKKE